MRKIIKTIFIFILAAVLLICGTISVIAAQAKNYLLTEVYFDSTNADDYYEYISSTSSDNLLKITEFMFTNYGKVKGDNILIVLQVFCERFGEFEEEKIIKIIEDEDKDSFYRCNLITLVCDLYSSDYTERLISIMNNTLSNEDVRIAIINNIHDSPKVIETLTVLAEDTNERVAYHSLKNLYNIEPLIGIKISEMIMDMYTDTEKGTFLTTDKAVSEWDVTNGVASINVGGLKAALQNLAYDYSIDNIYQLKNGEGIYSEKQEQFIEICKSIIENDTYGLKNATIYCLSDMIHPDAIRYLIDSDYVSESKKTFAVNMNYLPLIYLAKQEESSENVALLCRATMLRPFEEFITVLRDCNTNYITSECKEMMDLMEKKYERDTQQNYKIYINPKIIER